MIRDIRFPFFSLFLVFFWYFLVFFCDIHYFSIIIQTQEIINININIDIDEWISIILRAISRMRMIRIFTYEYDTNEKYCSNYASKYEKSTLERLCLAIFFPSIIPHPYLNPSSDQVVFKSHATYNGWKENQLHVLSLKCVFFLLGN